MFDTDFVCSLNGGAIRLHGDRTYWCVLCVFLFLSLVSRSSFSTMCLVDSNTWLFLELFPYLLTFCTVMLLGLSSSGFLQEQYLLLLAPFGYCFRNKPVSKLLLGHNDKNVIASKKQKLLSILLIQLSFTQTVKHMHKMWTLMYWLKTIIEIFFYLRKDINLSSQVVRYSAFIQHQRQHRYRKLGRWAGLCGSILTCCPSCRPGGAQAAARASLGWRGESSELRSLSPASCQVSGYSLSQVLSLF